MVFNWKLRPKGDKLNPYMNYNGFSVIEVSGMLKELGYDNPNIKIRYKKPTSDLDKGLEPLSKDIDVMELLNYVHKLKLIELFMEHPVDKCVINESVIDLDQEDNSVIDGLESSNAGLGTHKSEALENDNTGLGTQESEGIDNDNVEELDPLFSYPKHQPSKRTVKIDGVHVDIEMFKKNTDPSVEWVGSTESQPQEENNDQFLYEECDLEDFDSDVDLDDDEAERKKALRKIINARRLILVEKMRELYLTKNDKERVKAECRENDPNLFSLKVNHGGRFTYVYGPKRTRAPRRIYKGGNADWFDDVDTDGEDYNVIDGFESSNAGLGTHESEALENDNAGLGTQESEGIDNNNVEELDPLFSYPKHQPSKRTVKILVEKMRELYLTKNDKERVRAECRGLVPVFSDTGPSGESVSNVEGPTNGPSGSQNQPSRIWQGCHEEMYRFKINPCNGPDLWPPSDSPIILTPPDYHTPIGRPPKKRKKSDSELYDGMMKDGKLSRVGKTITCLKCGQKGNNGGSCKGQRAARFSKATASKLSPAKKTNSSGKRKVGE
nr:hypothetical protein [Tanacetum cinerariifolium]